MDRYKDPDIPYHFIIAGNGTIFEGAELRYRGTHTYKRNTGTVGIALIGNFNDEQPTGEQMNALSALVSFLRSSFNGITHLAGHKDFRIEDDEYSFTDCPGTNLYPKLSGIAAEQGLQYGTGGYREPWWIQDPPSGDCCP
jgi:N-acetylmuramoyl-L-alanine amidase